MKVLIIYYSLDWNTKLVSETIAETIWADIIELQTKEEIVNKNSFMKYLWWWRMVMMKQEPELLEININFDSYDLIIIGIPVWAWNYSPPITTFFKKYKIVNKKVAVFCCHWWWPGKTLQNMKDKLIWNEFIAEIDWREPVKRDIEINKQKIIKWAESLEWKM